MLKRSRGPLLQFVAGFGFSSNYDQFDPARFGVTSSAMAKPHATLIFSRHGESQWNVDNRFTGWVDATLVAGSGVKRLGKTEGPGPCSLSLLEGVQLDITGSCQQPVMTIPDGSDFLGREAINFGEALGTTGSNSQACFASRDSVKPVGCLQWRL